MPLSQRRSRSDQASASLTLPRRTGVDVKPGINVGPGSSRRFGDAVPGRAGTPSLLAPRQPNARGDRLASAGWRSTKRTRIEERVATRTEERPDPVGILGSTCWSNPIGRRMAAGRRQSQQGIAPMAISETTLRREDRFRPGNLPDGRVIGLSRRWGTISEREETCRSRMRGTVAAVSGEEVHPSSVSCQGSCR